MAPHHFTDDYYAILGVKQTADGEEIKSSYKRLARLRHPDKNINKPNATSEFQLLQAAFSTLSDLTLRRVYDTQYSSIRLRTQATAASKKAASASQATNTGETPPRADASNEASSQADNTNVYQQRIKELEGTLQELRLKKSRLDSSMFEARRKVNQSQSVLNKLQVEAEKEAEDDASQNSWVSFFLGKRLSAAEVEAKERRATERRMGQIVRKAELERFKKILRQVEAQMDSLDAELVKVQAEQLHMQQRARYQQKAAEMAEEARRRAQENERAQQERERARKQQEEEEEARVKRSEVWERWRKQEEERRSKEEEAAKKSELYWERIRKAQAAQYQKHDSEQTKAYGMRSQGGYRGNAGGNGASRPGKTADATSCQHQRRWSRESGRHVCSRCQWRTSKFVFRCPDCRIVACAECRKILREE